MRLSAIWPAVCVLLLALVAAPVPAQEEMTYRAEDGVWPTIVAIEFEGNEVTRPAILLQEMVVAVGDPATPEAIEASRQNIMNLALFERVEAETRPAEGGVVLVIRVEEKFYILPLPRFSRSSDGDISYGAKVSFDNLLGYNQSLELLYEETDVADDTRETEASIGYSIARIPGTDYGLSLVASRTTAQEEVIAEDGRRGRYDDERERYTLGVSRWLSRRAPSRGWRAAVGATTSRDDYTFVSGETGLREDERIVTLSLGIEHTAVEEYTYNRGGFIYGWRLGASLPALGSDEETKQVDFFWRRYQRLGADLEHNFNMQFRVGGAFDSSPLKQTFKLGGSDTLRGFEVDAFQGDTYIVANLEYLHTSPWTRRLRGAVFTDLGNAYPEGRIDLGDLEAGIGLGLRYKIPWLVRIDLRVDVAQGLGSEGILRVYAGTRASF